MFLSARGKKKIFKALLPILFGIGAVLLLLAPVGIFIVGFLAVKALAVSKIALLIAGFVALQKLLGSGFGGFGGGKNGWSTGGSGWNSIGSGWNSASPGGWSTSASGASSGYYRSFDSSAPVDAHQMAYKAQVPQ
jgi:hypothetical protein